MGRDRRRQDQGKAHRHREAAGQARRQPRDHVGVVGGVGVVGDVGGVGVVGRLRRLRR